MALDDRDRTFEKALARQLRSSASSGVNASALSGAHADRPIEPLAEICPDPEMLAAYHDGSLSLEERNLWKPHVLSCERCQFVLAHLETPLDVPVSLATEEIVLASQQAVSSGKTASPARVARPSFIHSLRWLWLVPAGAIAAFLVAWVSLQRPKPSPLAPISSVEVADNRQPLAITPSAAPALTAPSDSKVSKEKLQTVAPTAGEVAGAAPATRDLASNESQNQLQALPRIQSQNSRNASHGPFLNQQKQEQQMSRGAAGSAGGIVQKKLDTQATPSAGDRMTEVLHLNTLPPPPPPAPASSEPSFLDSGSVSAPLKDKAPSASAPKPAPAASSGASASKSQPASADAISSLTQTVEVSEAPQSAFNGAARMRAAALQNPHVVAAPGEKQLWRIGLAGSLEHSKDKGLTWISQISGVYTDLLAGSAPSAKICWIVGASGTILRTTDGGTHWSKLDSPVTNNLTGVRATDAIHASIWFVPDQQTGLVKTYQTSDGGSTWVSVPSE
jgi:hypothetical protein